MDVRAQVREVLKLVDNDRVQAAEVYAEHSDGWTVLVADRFGARTEQRRVDVVSIGLWGRAGQSVRVRGPIAEAAALVARGLQNLERAPSTGQQGPVEPELDYRPLQGAMDARLGSIDLDDRMDAVRSAARSARGVHKGVLPGEFEYSDATNHRAYANSLGVEREETTTSFRLRGTVHLVDSGRIVERIQSASTFSSVAVLPLGRTMADEAASWLGRHQPFEGTVRTVLGTAVVAEILGVISRLSTRVQRDRGDDFISDLAAKPGMSLSHFFHITDDGRRSGSARARGFDERGIPGRPLVLFRDGRPEETYVSSDDGPGGGAPTGHDTSEGLVFGHLGMRAGVRSMTAILSDEAEPVFYLDHIWGLEDGLDYATGRFKAVGAGRYIVPRNQVAWASERVTIEGSILDLLTHIQALGSDTDRWDSKDVVPVLTDGLRIST